MTGVSTFVEVIVRDKSELVIETLVANKSPFYDSSHHDNNFQSRHVTPGLKLFSYNLDMPRLVKRISWSSSHESY